LNWRHKQPVCKRVLHKLPREQRTYLEFGNSKKFQENLIVRDFSVHKSSNMDDDVTIKSVSNSLPVILYRKTDLPSLCLRLGFSFQQTVFRNKCSATLKNNDDLTESFVVI